MKIHVLAVGNRMPEWIEAAWSEYEKRMPREAKVVLREIRPEKRDSGKSVPQIQEIEAVRVRAAMPKGCLRIVLDERGESLSTMELARLLEEWMSAGRDIAIAIGGADGTSQELREEAEKVVSFSRMTLPHGLARVMLVEQLYRALSIIHHHPYHREG